jgi:hypothetical protein
MKSSSLFITLVLATVLPMSAQDKVEKPKSVQNQKTVTQEPLGQLALGQTPAEVVKLLGKAESKGKKSMQEATGTSVQDWNYPAKGLTITMEFIGKDETVHMIRATEACTLATARGIKIGSTEAAVKKAYAKEKSKEGSKAGESFLAGSLHDGLSFTFKAGKVSEIFLGVTSE